MKRRKKWWHWLLISLGGVVAAVILLLVVAIVGSRGTLLTGGVPLGKVPFTAGDIPGFPVYPGAVQSTEGAGVPVPDDMRRVIPQDEAQWKLYTSSDGPAQVLAWYDKAMADAGYERSQPRESGVAVFFLQGYRYGLYVTLVNGQTNIILARGKGG